MCSRSGVPSTQVSTQRNNSSAAQRNAPYAQPNGIAPRPAQSKENIGL